MEKKRPAIPYKFKSLLVISVYFLFYILTASNLPAQETEDTNTYRTPTIEVDAFKGIEKVVPIVLETIKKETIEKRYWMQDLPMFLSGSTNIYSYSESGSSMGYSYFTIRGFDHRRLSILVNGTPQNDAEEHQVYWVELSDIAASTENIQIQRGISTALFGTSGIGGVINLQTADYFRNKFVNLNAGYGAYNSRRFSMEYSSGLSQSGFGFYGKFSKTFSSGYRNLSWSDHWSYFLSAGKVLGENSVIKMNIYGSPVKNHAAFRGITKNYLDGNVTQDISADRRYNPIEYPNEVSEFHQPHYELIYNIQASKNVFISNTFNYIRREGFYKTNYPISAGYDFHHFRLPYFYAKDTFTYNINYYLRSPRGRIDSINGIGYTVARSDLVANLVTNSNDYGWYPKVHIRHTGDIGNLVIGGEFRLHRSEHYGEIDFANTLPPGTPDRYKYYYYHGNKNTYSVYLNEFTNMAKRLSGMFGLQLTYHKYSIDNSEYTPYNFDVDYKFLTSRLGFNFNITENLRTFANLSIARREPRLSEIYDGSIIGARPNLRIADTLNGIYKDPYITYEEMNDYELGIGYADSKVRANLNFYLMKYTNEIVSNGQIDNFGQPVTWNAGKSIHRGVELEAELNLIDKNPASKTSMLTLSGNISLSDNYFVNYIEKTFIDTNGLVYGNDYSGNRILLNPQVIGNLSLNFTPAGGIYAYVTLQHIGMQYLDNSENERKNPERRNAAGYIDKVINAYTVFNAGLSIDLIPVFKPDKLGRFFRTLEASFKINNIFDTMYETTGGVSANGVPLWIPAAERNLFFNLRVGF